VRRLTSTIALTNKSLRAALLPKPVGFVILSNRVKLRRSPVFIDTMAKIRLSSARSGIE
jgi:hypothetical protein